MTLGRDDRTNGSADRGCDGNPRTPAISSYRAESPLDLSCQHTTGALSSDGDSKFSTTFCGGKSMTRFLRLSGLVLLLVALSGLVFAQTETGQISGTVTDPSGAVVPNAKVTLTATATDYTRAQQTNSAGLYAFPNLIPGEYQVKVEAAGFNTSAAKVVLTVGARAAVDIKLEVGRTDTVVQVSESAVQVNTETQTLGTNISTQQIMELPTLTRNPYALVAIAGNVSEADPSGRGVGYAINGLRAASTNVLLDGAANNDEFTASAGQNIPLDSVQEFSVLTNNFTAEFGRATGGVVNATTKSGTNDLHGTAYWFNRVSALAANSFDRNANSIDKPTFTRNQPGFSVGGPIVKNKLFFFGSSEWIRVRSQDTVNVFVPTDQLISQTAANTKDFFSAFGSRRDNLQSLGTFSKAQLLASGVNVCSGAAAGGPCQSLPADLPIFERMNYAVPSDSGGGAPQNTNFGVGRVDYNVSEKTQIYGRYAWEKIDQLVGSNANSPYAGFDSGVSVYNNNFLASVVHMLSPTMISQSKAVFNRLNNTQPLGDNPPTPTIYLANSSGATRMLGTVVGMPGYLPFNAGSAIPFGGPQNFVQLYQDLSVFKGRHQFRMGGNYTYIRDNRTFGAFLNPVQQLGTNLGRGLDNLIRGQVYNFQSAIDPQGKYPCNGVVTEQCSVKLPVGQPNFSRSNRYHEVAFYVQDTWKATQRLTLNLGMRYEYFGVQHNKDPYLDSNFYPALGGTEFQQLRDGDVALAPNSYAKGLWRPDYNNIAPRLGFAYDLTGDGKTSLRGGYSMGYERNFGNVTFNVIQNPPNYAVIALIAGADVPSIPISTELAGPLAGNVGVKAIPSTSLRAVNPELKTAYAQLWSLALEREVTNGLFVAAEYSGSRGSGLYSLENPNRPGAGNVFLGTPCTKGTEMGDPGNCTARLLATRSYTNINMRNGKGFSNFHSMNFRVQYRDIARTGLTLTSNYTWGHAIDNLSSTFSESGNNYVLGLLDPFNPKLDRGDADFDLRHRWSMGAVWELPFAKGSTGVKRMLLQGWQFAPILTMRTGNPYTMWDCHYCFGNYARAFFLGDVPRMGNANNVPTGTPNVNKWLDLSKVNVATNWVNPITNTTDFGPFPATMSGRNAFRTPGAWNLDLGVYKTVRWTERLSTQLRLEMFNAMNHANLYVDTGNADVSSTDYISSYRADFRNVQLGLKFIF
jgi:outer membrane receptor protein involved in Fe transport